MSERISCPPSALLVDLAGLYGSDCGVAQITAGSILDSSCCRDVLAHRLDPRSRGLKNGAAPDDMYVEVDKV
jgi:hypothetical protein